MIHSILGTRQISVLRRKATESKTWLTALEEVEEIKRTDETLRIEEKTATTHLRESDSLSLSLFIIKSSITNDSINTMIHLGYQIMMGVIIDNSKA